MSDKIEREGKIFETGDYPDKNVKVTETDLDDMVKNFSPVPVDIEHSSTPFDGILGTLNSVFRKGKELWGNFAFDNTAWQLIEKANAKKCSVSYSPTDKKLTGIGLVKNPRVKSAQIFTEGGDNICFHEGYILDGEKPSDKTNNINDKEIIMSETKNDKLMSIEDAQKLIDEKAKEIENAYSAKFNEQQETINKLQSNCNEYDEKIFSIQKERKNEIAEVVVSKWFAEGKMLPKNKDFAMAILTASSDDEIKFSDEVVGPISKLFCDFMNNQEAIVSFKETAQKTGNKDIDADSANIAEKYFGLSKENYLKYADPNFKI